MKAAELFVKALENEGVQYIFGVPGEENLDLMEALRTSSIKFVITRNEQAAGFMAATVGRLTGKTGVCLSTLGPGATNFVTSAAYAQLGAMPMLMITGQKPIKKSKQGHFQIVDTTAIMQPVTKFSKQIISAAGIPALVREAFKKAEEERPGAVHLELPEDIAAEETDGEAFAVLPMRRPVAEVKAIAQAVEMIEQAKMPLLLIGAGANRKRTSKMLLELVEKTGIPFFNTQMGKGVLDERHPKYMGCAALSSNDYIHCAIERADLIINVGHDVIEKPPFIMKKTQKVIHINFLSAAVDQIYFPDLEVVGDIANAIWQIKEAITEQKTWNFDYFARVKKDLEEHISDKSDSNSFPLLPQRIVADTRNVLADDAIVALDNGMYKLWFARNYKSYQPNTLLLDNALATMGAGLSSAIAAKLLNPDKQVITITGDGGFMMNTAELETAQRLELDLVVVILNDNGFGMIKWKQDAAQFKRFALDFSNPDFIKLAESFGATGYHVATADGFAATLKQALAAKGVQIIEVAIDYSENDRVLTKELAAKTCLL